MCACVCACVCVCARGCLCVCDHTRARTKTDLLRLSLMRSSVWCSCSSFSMCADAVMKLSSSTATDT